jgi:pyruvate,water dikinase
VSLAPSISEEIAEALRRIAPGERVAVRSSACDEDGANFSFGGQLDSFLHVDPASVPEKILAVWQSGFSERVLAYRREHGLTSRPGAPAVLIQRMVLPRVAGVAFGADPVSGRRGMAVVSAVPGLGSALVSGEADADTWLVDREGHIIERRIVAGQPSLDDAEIRQVAAMARAAGRHFGRPQDIEWAIGDGLVLLQSRPITSMRAMADPDSRATIWDNSNIVESYSGVTTPLTFTFGREVYEHVYREFCRMMGVPERTIAAEDETFQNMLGLVRGRLYYNLLSWYRMLAMLPGYRLNRRYMEQMMGVKEALPDAFAADIASRVRRGRALDALRLVRTCGGLIWNHLTLDRRVRAFQQRLDSALAPTALPLQDLRVDELVGHYRDLRSRLLLSWDAPIVNDFFVMIFYGLLRNLVIRWCGDASGSLQNDLIAGEHYIVSAEPAVRIQRLARLAASHPDLVALLGRGTTSGIDAALAGHPELAHECREYLAKFGDRTVKELKLESVPLHDDPLPLYRAVGSLAQQYMGDNAARSAGEESTADRLRRESKRRVQEALATSPLRRAVFGWVLRNAQRRVRDRENLRLERSRLFGRVRRIFLEVGKRFHEVGLLDEPRDIFHLEVGEVLAYAEGRSTVTDLRSLTALRKREFRAYDEGPAPHDRFETRGPVYYGHDYRRAEDSGTHAGHEIRGIGCSPGIVRGRVRIVTDPTTTAIDHGTILVAEHTDPGWVLVFPCARGILVERGSLLSHAAIVARELGIPAVVSIPGITRWLHDDDWVEMDGSTGTVRRISAPGNGDA